MTGTDILMVPYKGVAEAMTDVLAGRMDMFFVGTQIALQHVQAGKAARARGHRREALEGHAGRADDAGSGASRTSTSSTGSACGCRPARRRTSSTGCTPRW